MGQQALRPPSPQSTLSRVPRWPCISEQPLNIDYDAKGAGSITVSEAPWFGSRCPMKSGHCSHARRTVPGRLCNE